MCFTELKSTAMSSQTTNFTRGICARARLPPYGARAAKMTHRRYLFAISIDLRSVKHRSSNGMLSARRAGGSSSAYLTSAGRGQWLFPDDARSLELGAVIDMATDARAVSVDGGSAFAAPARTRGDLARAARGSSTATRVARRSRTSPSTPRGHARRLAPDVEHGDALDGGRCTAGWRPGKLL